MPISTSEAQAALSDIAKTSRASATTYGYRHASPHLIVWGVIWALGYGLSYLRPQYGATWPVLVLIGTVASFWVGWKSRPAQSKGYDWRYAATALAALLFITAIYAIMPPRTGLQAGAFFPILIALLYGLIGIWTRGTRMLIAGIALAALTLGGYFLLPQYFMPWMAVVGGGALILGGFWLRTV
ncbi:MAG TPA: hypothetical protein VHT03_00995 [Rhizomicrobium sp.]|nr:hypothetical protein [Rhizomicrobium sp.]